MYPSHEPRKSMLCARNGFASLAAICCLGFSLSSLADSALRDLKGESIWSPCNSVSSTKARSKVQGGELEVASCRAGTKGLVALVYDPALATALGTSFPRLYQDMEHDGFSVELKALDSTLGNPAKVKEYLKGLSPKGIVGSLFLGPVPNAQVYLANDFFGAASYPSDLYYASFNDSWALAADGQQQFTVPTSFHTNIWIGRIDYSHINAGHGFGSIEMYQKYLDREHAYRTSPAPTSAKAFEFVDNDWVSLNYGLSAAFTDLTSIRGNGQITPENYRPKLNEGYHYVITASHSNPEAHYFSGGMFYATELWNLPVNVRFWQLWACSNARFDTDGFMGGTYFAQATPLVVEGSSKTGSMLSDDSFFAELKKGRSYGDVFNGWLTDHMGSLEMVQWHSGLTLIGDPTLTVFPAKLAPNASAGSWNEFSSETLVLNPSYPDPSSVDPVLRQIRELSSQLTPSPDTTAATQKKFLQILSTGSCSGLPDSGACVYQVLNQIARHPGVAAPETARIVSPYTRAGGDMEVRIAATQALGAIGGPIAKARLRVALADFRALPVYPQALVDGVKQRAIQTAEDALAH